MKKCLILLGVCLLAASTQSAVRVFVQDSNGVAAVKYECTAGEVVRSFALDVSLDRGQVVGITNFFRGESKVGAQGYGIFPAAFRDHITVSSGSNANWTVSGYTPLAVVADSPTNTLPGLNSSGVTLELGGLWDAANPATFPPAAGTLCTLRLSEAAQVSVAANASRGGVLSASSGVSITPTFTGAVVIPPGGAPTITNQPTNMTVCVGSPAIFRVGATGWRLTYQWQVSADGGTTFTNISETATNANYTNLVATLANNGEQYQVIVGGTGGPSAASAPPAVLTVNAPATVSAGGDQTICEGSSTAGLGGSVGGGATGGTWSSSGTGTFAPDATTLNATYNPSAADIAAGTVTLGLTATGQLAPCGEASAQVVLTINPAPTANASGNQTICAGSSTAGLGGSIGGGATGATWSSSGTGSFAPNTAALNATYNPSPADIAVGTVTLTLSATGQLAPCSEATELVVLTINPAATVNAGDNQAIAAGSSTAGLGGSVGGGATGGTWSSSGTGTFAPDATALNATYNPSAADVAAGTVTLTLSSTGQLGPCGKATAPVGLIIRGMVGIQLANGVITISFAGGELQTAPNLEGPWTGTGNRSGTYTNAVTEGPAQFYRVQYP